MDSYLGKGVVKEFLQLLNLDESFINKNWESYAKNIVVKTTLKKKRQSSGKSNSVNKNSSAISPTSVEQDMDAFVPRNFIKPNFDNLNELINSLRQWLVESPDAKFVNGHGVIKTTNGKTEVKKNDPKEYFRFKLDFSDYENLTLDLYDKDGHQFQLHDFSGTYKVHGDTKVDAIKRLINLYEEDSELLSVFTPWLNVPGKGKRDLIWDSDKSGYIGSSKKKVKLSSDENTNGFFAYFLN